MKPKSTLRNFLALAGSSLLAVSYSQAAPYYWDLDGATPGSGPSTTPTGTWSTGGTTWSTDPLGAIATSAYTTTSTDDLFFSAGTDATGTYTITLSGTQDAKSLTTEDGTVVLSGIINLGGTGNITTRNASTTIGLVAGTAGLTKLGAGKLNLSGSAVHTFTGGLRVNNGTLELVFNNLSTPTNLVDSTNALSFGGGLMIITGKTTLATAQTFAGTTVGVGGGSLLVNPNNGTSTTVTLGALTTTASGSSLVLGKAITANTGTVTLTTTTNKDSTGIYGGRVVFANGTASTGYDWATSTGGPGTFTLGSYSGYNTTLPTSGSSSSDNYSITAGITQAASQTVNSLKITGLTTALDLGATTLTIKSGGLLSVGTVAQTISGTAGNKLTAGSGAGGSEDLVIHQYNTFAPTGATAGLVITAVIGDNTAGTGNTVNLVKSGINTLVLQGANTYTGNTFINAGTLVLGSPGNTNTAGSLGNGNYAGNISIASGAQLSVRSSSAQTLSGVISGDGSLFKGGNATLTLSDINTYTGSTSMNAIAASISGGILSVSSLNSVGTGPGYAPRASSSLGAPTTVANGTINFGSASVGNNATLRYTGPGETTDRVLNFQYNNSSPRTLEASGTGLLKFVSPVLASGGGGAGTIGLSGTGLGEIAGAIPANGTLGVTKSGDGTWTLSSTNLYAGPTAVSLGTLIARSAQALGTTSTANVSITAGASATGLNYVAATDTALNIGGTLTINGGANTFIGGSIGSTATSASINVAGNALVPTAAVKVNVYGVSGASRLAGTNTYTLISGLGGGATTLNSGTYTLGTVFNNTDFTVGSITKSTTGLFIDVTKQTALTSGTFYVGGLSGASNVWAASNGSTASNFATSSGGTSQVLVPGSAASVTIDNNSNATFTVLGADMSISGLTISDNTNNFALNGHGYSLTIGTGGITKSNTTTKTATIAANIVLGGNQTWSNSDTGNALVISGSLTGAGTLTKSGAGTVTLSNANAYTGATTVTDGKLIVNGNISTSVLTTVQTGATLGGSGTVGALTVAANGIVAPGNSPDTFDVNGAYTQLGIYQAEINAKTVGNGTTGYDQISVAGTVNITGGSLNTIFSGTGYVANDLIFILLNDSTDAITGTYATFAQDAVVTTFGGLSWKISYNADSVANTFTGTPNGNDIALMAIPEPNVASLIGAFGGILLLRRRRG